VSESQPAAASAPLRDVASRWTELGRDDPMWAALTLPGKSNRGKSRRGRSGGRRSGGSNTGGSKSGRGERTGWTEAEFLATGRQEIDGMLARLDELNVSPRRGTALDFGCGPGRLTAALAAAGFSRAIGLDISPSMLDTARRLVASVPESSPEHPERGRCEFRHNDGPTLAGIADGSVDLVYTCRVLQHMPPALAAGYLREFFRVTAPGGLVVFQLPSEPAPGVVGGLLRRLPTAWANRLRRGMQMHGTAPTEVTALVAAAGGRTVAIEPDTSAGPRWRSYLYITEVHHRGTSPRPGVTTAIDLITGSAATSPGRNVARDARSTRGPA
jgi:SAM-dependent methyltransferase